MSHGRSIIVLAVLTAVPAGLGVAGVAPGIFPDPLTLTGDGVSIHAAEVRESSASHGCIGVPEAFARLLFDAVAVGNRVSVS